MATFKKQTIIELQKKLQSKLTNPSTEEATKQWLIMPLIVALGYDPFSTDIIPEFTLDVGTKKGEKVDYALQINNQPVALIECKQLKIAQEVEVSTKTIWLCRQKVNQAIMTMYG